jgi:hypothetical protein
LTDNESQRLVHIALEKTRARIWITDKDGNRIGGDEGVKFMPVPDGHEIVFRALGADSFEYYVVNGDGRPRRERMVGSKPT